MTRLCASVASKAPARSAQQVPAATVARSQGEAVAKSLHRRSAPHLREVETDGLENGVVRPTLILEHFLGEEAHINHADDPLSLVDHGEGEKLVEHEKFASFQHGGARRDADHAPDHDLFQGRLEGCGQEPPRGEDTDQPLLLIDREKNK